MKRFQTEKFNYQHLKIENPSDSEYFHNHMHNGYELPYSLGGNANFTINASIYHMQKRDFFLIHSGDSHSLSPNPDTLMNEFASTFRKKRPIKIPFSITKVTFRLPYT